MSRALLALSLLLALAPAVWAQASAVMAVSVTVVNTCQFGADARCARPQPSLRQAGEQVTVSATGTTVRRVVHL